MFFFLQTMWEWVTEATTRFNTLPTAAVPGPPRRPDKHPMEIWNKILGLALYCHTCLHTFVFLALQAAFTSSNTTGTVVTQTYLLQYHGNSHGDSGETYNTMETVTETVARLTIPQEQSQRQWWDIWYHGNSVETVVVTQNISNDKDLWQKVSDNLIKLIKWKTIQHYGCQFGFENMRT